MKTKEELLEALKNITAEHGDWSYDIPLPFGVCTKGNLNVPHTRLRRIVQTVSDMVGRPLAQCRILDLACLEGLFSIEFARHGASTVGVEIRDANIGKARFCKEQLGLENLEFRQDDVRNISLESYGRFDAIICSGILYHLTAADAIHVIRRMYEMVERVVVIDTHVALEPVERFVHEGVEYRGCLFREHADNATLAQKKKALWASADNPTSFWFTRPSLINLLGSAGFSSVYECYNPAHLNFGDPGIEHRDRCTFAALKGGACEIGTSPSVNALQEKWPEGSLSYAAAPKAKTPPWAIFSKR